jgi:serine/threonine protein kinase
MPLAPGTRLGPYEVVSLLGAGGMGEVYRARDPRLGRDLAIKVLPPDLARDETRRRRFSAGSARGIGAQSPEHPDQPRGSILASPSRLHLVVVLAIVR